MICVYCARDVNNSVTFSQTSLLYITKQLHSVTCFLTTLLGTIMLVPTPSATDPPFPPMVQGLWYLLLYSGDCISTTVYPFSDTALISALCIGIISAGGPTKAPRLRYPLQEFTLAPRVRSSF